MFIQIINEVANPKIQMNDPDMTWLGIYAIIFKIVLPILFCLFIVFVLFKFFQIFKRINQSLQEINKNTEMLGGILTRKMEDKKNKES